MKTAVLIVLGLLSFLAGPQVRAQTDSGRPTIVLTGATLIDLSNSGRSRHDIPNAIVVIRDGTIEAAGPASLVKIPKNSQTLDYSGAYILPGLVDGFAGLNSQAQANANLYMGVTTIVGSQDDRRGMLTLHAHPSPHVYPLDSAGLTDDHSLLMSLSPWSSKLKESNQYVELSEQDTKAQIAETARRGTRVIWLGHNVTAANVKFIIEESHRHRLITYGESLSTPYADSLNDGVDVLLHMTRYALGLVPFRLQQPMVQDPDGAAQEAAYAYLRQLDSSNPSIRAFGNQIKNSRTALMPTLSLDYLLLPGHRNLWKEPAASILDTKDLHQPPDVATGEAKFPSEEARRLKTAEAIHFWAINRTLQATHPAYLAASGSSALGTMPGISMHTELELLVRMGLSPREALAAATSNYSERFGWHELGLVEAGRRADLLILTADPTVDISNTRKIRSVILDGMFLDRAALLVQPR